MVKCQEFYEQFNKLREMAKEIKGYCEVDARQSIGRFGRYIEFCQQHNLEPLGSIPEKALRPLIKEWNEDIAQIVVKQLKKRMESNNPKFARITEKVVKKTINQIRKEQTPSLPSELFDIIYADPPWKYEINYLSGAAEKHYQTMTVEEISDLKIPTSQNTILFLWATNPMLENALQVMKAWGFRYKTNLAWIKNKFGTGFYVRGQHELLLIGVKGDAHCPEQSNRPPSILKAPVREHSQKPDEVYDIIEKMYPGARFLELFARQKREGWEVWGNEV